MVKDVAAKTFPVQVPAQWTKELYSFGRHAYFADERLSLRETIDGLKGNQSLSKVRYVHISCDILDCSNSENESADSSVSSVFDLSRLSSKLQYIHIYARQLTIPSAHASRLDFITDSEMALRIVWDKVSPGMSVVVAGQASDGPQKLEAAACELFSDQILCPEHDSGHCLNHHFSPTLGATGAQIKFKDNSMTVQGISTLSDLELGGSSVEDFKTFGGSIRRADNLSKLLHWQFVQASQEVTSVNPPLDTIISRLNFIIRCGNASLRMVELVADAKTLLDRLQAPKSQDAELDEPQRFYVPVQNIKECNDSLKERLDRAIAMHGNIEKLESASSNATELHSLFTTVIKQMGMNMLSFQDPEMMLTEAVEAIKGLYAAKAEMEKLSLESEKAKTDFENEVNAFYVKQQQKAKAEAYMAVFNLVSGVVQGVADIQKLKGIGEAIVAINGLIEHSKETSKQLEQLKKLAEVAQKMWPKLEAAWKNQASFQLALTSKPQGTSKEEKTKLKAGDTLTASAEKIMKDSEARARNLTQIDFWSMIRDWDMFDLEVESTFKSLEIDFPDNQLKTMESFRVSYRKLAIQGRLVVSSMREVQDKSQRYYREFAETKARQTRHKELTALSEEVKDSEKTSGARDILVYNARLRLQRMRRSVFLSMHATLLAYLYEFNESTFPTDIRYKQSSSDSEEEPSSGLSADLMPNEFDTLQSKLKTKIDNMLQTLRNVQSVAPTFNFNTDDHVGTVFAEDWKDKLVRLKRLDFSIPASLNVTKGYYRIRIIKANAIFHGLPKSPKTNSKGVPNDINYRFTAGPLFSDIDHNGDELGFYREAMSLRKIVGNAGGALQDVNNQFTRPTIFAKGFVVFDDGDVDESMLGMVTGVELEFAECSAVGR